MTSGPPHRVVYADPTAVGASLVPGVSQVHKFGINAAVGATYETIWSLGGAYTFIARRSGGSDASTTAHFDGYLRSAAA